MPVIAKILLDLDLTLVSKDGVMWAGNTYTTSDAGTGPKWDHVNNAEQIRIPKDVWHKGSSFSSFSFRLFLLLLN